MDALDISHTLVARSDQLNADDLVGGDITVRITGVNAGDGEQPVVVAMTGGHKPWKPCKTMRRVLAHAWGTDASAWVGRSLKLYRDPTVRWAGSEIGGIRIRAMSDIPSSITIKLAETKGGKKIEHKVAVLKPETAASQPITNQTPPPPMTLDQLTGWIAAAQSKRGWTDTHISDLLTHFGAATPDEVDPLSRRAMANRLKENAPAASDDEPS